MEWGGDGGDNPILIQYGISFSLNCYRCDDIIMTQLIEVDQIEPIINYPRHHSHTNKRVFQITCTRISLGGGGAISFLDCIFIAF